MQGKGLTSLNHGHLAELRVLPEFTPSWAFINPLYLTYLFPKQCTLSPASDPLPIIPALCFYYIAMIY